MYNERNEEFSIRDIVIQLLFVILFVFILVWLFPTKGDINKLSRNKNGNDINLEQAFEPLYARIFNENLQTMKEAAKDYFTTERVPKKVGDKVTITLSEMLDKKLLLPFVDSKGRQCDLNNSYVEVTKVNDEYVMKVNLSCTDNTDYILVPMGCYDFCKTAICEKPNTKPVVSKPSPTPVKPTPAKPTPTKPDPIKPDPIKPDPIKPDPIKPDPIKPDPVKPIEYLYEYSLTVNPTYTTWGNWSRWSTNYVRATDLVDVQTDVISEQVKKQIGVKKIEKQVPYTTTERVQVDNQVTRSCAKWETVYIETGKVKYGTEWNYSHTVQLTTPPRDTATTRYVRVRNSSGDAFNCGTTCSSPYSNYRVYTREVYPIKQGGYQCVSYDIKVTPVYINKTITKYKTETSYEPVYGYVTVKTTYYRYRTRNYKSGYTNKVWSVYNDQRLLGNGYKYTGNVKVK